MAITNHSELTTAVANWMQRDDFGSRAAEFVSLFESKASRGFSESQPFFPIQMEDSTTVACTATINFPTSWIELRNIKTTAAPTRKLAFVTSEVMDLTYTSSTAGIPKSYTIEGAAGVKTIRIGPTPSAGYSVKLHGYVGVPALSAGVNWLISYPDIYLYGSLLEAAAFMRDDPRVPMWKQAYDMAVTSLRRVDQRVRFGGSALQVTAA